MSTSDKTTLNLGVIGLSEGNGHPYSWSAIFNGYDAAAMATCPFPVIPEYLARQRFPADAISGARVTHIWTQDKTISHHVAKAALIPNIVDELEAMIGCVDGILLARDDAENHVAMSKPFLEAGLPIYIDKPIAFSLSDLDELYGYQRYQGQVFSCSALRYSATLRLADSTRSQLGTIRHVDAVVPNKWEKYAVHVLDPVLNMLGLYGAACDVHPVRVRGAHVVAVDWREVSACFSCLGDAASTIRIRAFGTKASAELIFDDTFASFRTALQSFVEGVVTRKEMTTRVELSSVVSILERGMLND